ncbi:MAG: helix-turn-helix transcriptional regulator [Acidobacteria bacterium]|nr:helix-turn-helix transcriptional regulator [Acidobacteriota bacterium]
MSRDPAEIDRATVTARAVVRSPRPRFEAIVDALPIAVLVFRRHQLVYANGAAQQLRERLRSKYRFELTVLLSDHIRGLDRLEHANTISLLTGQRGEPFHLHVTPLDHAGTDVAVSVRELGSSFSAFRSRYRLSRREAEVVELVLLGYRNRDIAATLGTAPTTIKKHLTHIFDKVGVDTRTQLIARLA